MKTLTMLLLGAMSLLAVACGDDDDGPADAAPAIDAAPTIDAAPPDAAGPPAKPALGAQLERMGRPAINTAANHTFDPDQTATDAAKHAYNVALPATWATFAPEVKANIAIIDGLDRNCGNQLGADLAGAGMRYVAMAGLLADDELYVNSNGMTCGAYLAVEADALGVLMNTDCGGRTLTYDVIDTSYSVLAVGALAGVTDGVANDGDGAGHSNTTFPFLGAPQ